MFYQAIWMRRASLALLVGFTAVLFSLLAAAAETLPQYEGVYIRLNDDSLLEVPSLSSSLRSFTATPNYIKVEPFTFEDVASAPSISESELQSIIINSRSDRLRRLNMVVRAGDFLGPYVNSLGVHGRNLEAIGGFDFRFVDDPSMRNHLVVGNWGWGGEEFRIRNIDQFNTVYEFKSAITRLGARRNSGVLNGKNPTEIEVFGFAIVTDNGTYPFFTSKKRSTYTSLVFPKSPAEVTIANSLALAPAGNGPILIYFFASWCVPCKLDSTKIADISSKVPVVGVAVDADYLVAKEFVSDNDMEFSEWLLNPTGENLNAIGIYGLPESLLVDRRGEILFKCPGPIFGCAKKLDIALSRVAGP